MATDFLGQTLNIGDDVIFLNYKGTSADLERGKITKLFPHTAEIGTKRRAEYKIVKIFADVAPVVHGHWVDGKCSNCGVDIPTDDAHDVIFENECRFCYYCGTKMDGGSRKET